MLRICVENFMGHLPVNFVHHKLLAEGVRPSAPHAFLLKMGEAAKLALWHRTSRSVEEPLQEISHGNKKNDGLVDNGCWSVY